MGPGVPLDASLTRGLTTADASWSPTNAPGPPGRGRSSSPRGRWVWAGTRSRGLARTASAG